MMAAILSWFAMGGYAPYIWSAYGLVVLALGLTWVRAYRQQKRVRALLRNWFIRPSA